MRHYFTRHAAQAREPQTLREAVTRGATRGLTMTLAVSPVLIIPAVAPVLANLLTLSF